MNRFAKGCLPTATLCIVICLLPVLEPNRMQAQQWQALPMVSQAMRDAGNTGGEGCQVPNGIAVDSTGNFLLMGTDVGGIYRSRNGGANWEPCNTGFKPRGGTGPAIDPNNSSRCLFAGCNSSSWTWHGLYLSTNQGDTWQSVLPLTYVGAEDYREQIAYDPGSPVGGMSALVYYSALSGGLYKSSDGGRTWSRIQTSFGGSLVKVHPTLRYVYVAATNGLFRSTDGGTNFTQITNGLSPGGVRGLDVIPTAPDNVYVNQTNGVYVSTDSGLTFARLSGGGLTITDRPGLNELKVSPANSNDMVINDDTGTLYVQPRFYSSDGGNTWQSAGFDSSPSFMPFNDRPGMFAWHPSEAGVCFSFGGDWITRSSDGGKTWVWDNQGYDGICLPSVFNFNVTNAGLLLCTSQDYNSVLSTNAGHTWTYLDVSGQSWGGFTYGGYAFSSTRMFAGNALSWGGTRNLCVSVDGGNTWTIQTNTASGTPAYPDPTDAACGDPNNPGVGFWDNWRTTDQGATWANMPACTGVYTYNPSSAHELYGSFGNTVVKSTDDGASWTTVATFSAGAIQDIAWDQVRNRLYVVAGGNRQLFMWQGGVITEITGRLPVDNNGSQGANTVAVDPLDPDVVYAGVHADIYCSSAGVVRSTDAGVTWTILTKQAAGSGLDGGREAAYIRVNPVTRCAYVEGSCYGLWKIGPPSPALNILPAGPASSGATLLWPTNTGAGFSLEQSPNLASPAWSVVTNVPAVSGSNFAVTLPAGPTNRFFRLSL